MLESGVGTSTSGSVATDSKPMGKMRTRGQGSMFKGISTSSKYANSRKAGISEDSVNEDELSEEQLQAKKRREENFKKAKDRELGNKPQSREIMAKEEFNGEYDDEAGMFKNNLQTIYVDVIDSRSKLLFLSSAPHPDISAMRSALSENENLTAEYQNINEFKIGDSRPDLVVWHEPGVGFDPAINALFLEKKIPILYCIGPNTSSSVVSKLNVGTTVTGSNQFDETQGGWNESFQQFEVGDELKKAIGFFQLHLLRPH